MMLSKGYIERAEEVILHTYNRFQIVLDKGNGVHLYDVDGKEYLDLLADALSSEQSAIVVDNSGKKPYIPIFVLSDGRLANIKQCPEYLQETHKQISDNMPEKPIKELLHLHKDIDVKKMTDEQRENFGQFIITKLCIYVKKKEYCSVLTQRKPRV